MARPILLNPPVAQFFSMDSHQRRKFKGPIFGIIYGCCYGNRWNLITFVKKTNKKPGKSHKWEFSITLKYGLSLAENSGESFEDAPPLIPVAVLLRPIFVTVINPFIARC